MPNIIDWIIEFILNEGERVYKDETDYFGENYK